MLLAGVVKHNGGAECAGLGPAALEGEGGGGVHAVFPSRAPFGVFGNGHEPLWYVISLTLGSSFFNLTWIERFFLAQTQTPAYDLITKTVTGHRSVHSNITRLAVTDNYIIVGCEV